MYVRSLLKDITRNEMNRCDRNTNQVPSDCVQIFFPQKKTKILHLEVILPAKNSSFRKRSGLAGD